MRAPGESVQADQTLKASRRGKRPPLTHALPSTGERIEQDQSLQRCIASKARISPSKSLPAPGSSQECSRGSPIVMPTAQRGEA